MSYPPSMDAGGEGGRFGRRIKVATALLLSLSIVAVVIPPGTISVVDQMRDSDNDGVSDLEELESGIDPTAADSDNDMILDGLDDCPDGDDDWHSTSDTDYDQDGCKDAGEDLDDDGDGIADLDDSCSKGRKNWKSSPSNDNDGDGCKDSVEDSDDDNDGVADDLDAFPLESTQWSDIDGDG